MYFLTSALSSSMLKSSCRSSCSLTLPILGVGFLLCPNLYNLKADIFKMLIFLNFLIKPKRALLECRAHQFLSK